MHTHTPTDDASLAVAKVRTAINVAATNPRDKLAQIVADTLSNENLSSAAFADTRVPTSPRFQPPSESSSSMVSGPQLGSGA